MLYQRLALVVLVHAVLYWKLRSCLGPGRWSWGYGVWAVFFALVPFAQRLGVPVGGRFFEILFALSITEYVIVGVASYFSVGLDVVRLFLFLWDRGAQTKLEARLTPCRNMGITLAATVCILLYGFCEAWNVREVRLVLATPKLPEGVERLRIVQISDIHLGGLYAQAHLARVMALVRALDPDLFVVTGDLVDGAMAHRNGEASLLAAHGARSGAFVVPGNHDFYAGFDQAVAFMERSGLTLLRDQAQEAGGIVVVGLDEEAGEELWPAELQTRQDRFVLLLKHYPQLAKGSHNKIDLQLSGHTHGGQIWPLGYAITRRYGIPQGLSAQGNGKVYVSNGTGFWGPPFRFLTPPEVTVIDLVPEAHRKSL